MTKEEFVKTYYPLAEKAGKKYKINPTVILAQAAHESGWGSSYAARVRKNFSESLQQVNQMNIGMVLKVHHKLILI